MYATIHAWKLFLVDQIHKTVSSVCHNNVLHTHMKNILYFALTD